MDKSNKSNQKTFLYVKQKLDYYRLPSTFPIQAIGLLEKLLEMLDQGNRDKLYERENRRYEQLRKESCSEDERSAFNSIIDQSMRLQLGKWIKQNNTLHEQIMTLKQQLSALSHVMSKQMISNSDMSKQLSTKQRRWIYENSRQREQEVLRELQMTKYKYNELMDMVHSDSNKDREFIKRLMKHKHMAQKEEKKQNEEVDEQKRSNNRNNNRLPSSAEHQGQLRLLRQKLSNRQNQILRLKSKLQFDGISMNRILNDFIKHKNGQQSSIVNQRIELLQKQNNELKKQIKSLRVLGGDKLPLKQHIDKLRKQNRQLKGRIEQMSKSNKQWMYNEKKQKKANSRRMNQVSSKLNTMLKQQAKNLTKEQQSQRANEILSKQLEEMGKRISQLESGMQQKCRLMQQMRQKLKQAQQQSVQYKRQLQNSKHEIQYQRTNSKQRQKQLIANYKSDYARQQLRSKQLQQQSELLKQTVANLDKVNQQNKRAISIMKRDSIQRTNHALINPKQEQQIKREEKLQVVIGEMNERLEDVSKLNTKVNQQYQQLNQQHAVLQHQHHQLTHQHQHLMQQHKLLMQQHKHSQTLNSNLHSQLAQYQLINQQFNELKQNYFMLQKQEKTKIRQLEMQIALIEEDCQGKKRKIDELSGKISVMESEVIAVNEKCRGYSKEMGALDEELHKLKIQKNRLQKKHHQLLAETQTNKQKQHSLSLIQQNQLLTQIQCLTRQLHKHKLTIDTLKQQLSQNQLLRNSLERQLQQLEKCNQAHKQQIQNHKQRQQLYEMEIRELKIIADQRIM